MIKILNKTIRYIKAFNHPSYIVFFVTARCNARCKMCFYTENMAKGADDKELTLNEYDKITKNIKLMNVLGISGGEPFLREDLAEIVKIVYKNCSPFVADIPTNAYFTDSVVRQVEDMARSCKGLVIDAQLSIDGPPDVHDEIRGLKGSFQKVKETYRGLVGLKKAYKRLRIKACVVYSHYNEGHILELMDILKREFDGLDRIVLSVAHGSVKESKAFDFDWSRYFKICDTLRGGLRVSDIRDIHSIFTLAARTAKNDYLKEALARKDMHRRCGAGRSVIAIGETGEVYPCEPLWRSVGNLRGNNYDLDKILNSGRMREFRKKMEQDKCNCHWGLPLSNAVIYKPRFYPKIFLEMARIAMRSSRYGP